ncbi:MAG: hypothetical protein LBI05_10955, partial [Planctomycetaceae bacterium]|nr:hypothetical protein [Planctomycetaceae bacterium]
MQPRVLEILDRLGFLEKERGKLCAEELVLRTELRERLAGTKRAEKPVPLTFGKNVITWDGGAVALEGLGYKFVKALYDSKSMKLKEATLGRLVWGQEPKHQTFKELVRWLAEKLERAKFPYQLLPVMSKERTVKTGEKYRDG